MSDDTIIRERYHVTYRKRDGSVGIYRTTLTRDWTSPASRRQRVKRNVAATLGIPQRLIMSVVNCDAAPQIGRRG